MHIDLKVLPSIGLRDPKSFIGIWIEEPRVLGIGGFGMVQLPSPDRPLASKAEARSGLLFEIPFFKSQLMYEDGSSSSVWPAYFPNERR